ncbi:MAG: PQQ-binding-like beta-propeller repeat protein [Candidatus Thermoplasmatota archaeon]
MKKQLISLLVLFLLVSSSLVGVSTQMTADTDTSEMGNDEDISNEQYLQYMTDWSVHRTNQTASQENSGPFYNNVESRATEPSPMDGPMDSAWPMFCHDIRHTGRSPYGPNGSVYLYEKWKVQLRTFVTFSSPVIDTNGTIYIGDWLGNVYAVYPNGTEKWVFKRSGEMTTPAINDNGTIYIGTSGGSLFAIHPNGTEKWTLYLKSGLLSSPAIALDGTIYIGASNLMCAVRPNGTLLWQYATGTAIKASPAIGNDGTVYVASHDGYLYAFYPSNGTVKWKVSIASGISCYSSPAIDDNGTIYYGTRYCLYAIAPNGTILWERGGSNFYGGPVIGYDGTIYACGGESLKAFASDGTAKWKVSLGSDESSPVVLKNGMILVFGEKELFFVTPQGRVVQRLAVTATVPIDVIHITSSPAVGTDGTVYVGSWFIDKQGKSLGYLHAFGMAPDEPPSEPTITGAEQGKIKQSYDYVVGATDPDGDNVSYYIDWGDGSTTGWLGPYDSGQEVTQSHTWSKKGTYTVMVMARDGHGLLSDWTKLPVTMPYSYEKPQFPFIHWLLERFPNAFPLLRYLIGFNQYL